MRVVLVLLLSFAIPVAAKPPVQPAQPAPPAAPPVAEPEEEEALPPGMTAGPATVSVGPNAQLGVLEKDLFGDGNVARAMLEKGGNLVSNREQGILLSESGEVIFEFDDVGYVKDDDKDSLDADKMLSSLREGQEEANEELKRLGRPGLELTGWHVKPHYDAVTHNLEWAPVVKNKGTGHQTVNYNVRLLGRRGVMEITLLVSPEKFDAALPWFRQTLSKFSYVRGEDYASYTNGDKTAAYGLAALVTGGAVAVAAKSGLLGRLWKFILLGLAALGGAIKRLFGGKSESSGDQVDRSEPPQNP
jgi:uncharacterized membrane-anchored protein